MPIERSLILALARHEHRVHYWEAILALIRKSRLRLPKSFLNTQSNPQALLLAELSIRPWQYSEHTTQSLVP
jgi:hypothetical protein